VFAFDTLVLATGAQPRRHPALSHLPGVLHLRTLDDAVHLGGHCTRGSRLAIVGAGLIGAEVASTALALGAAPILVEAAPAPLVRAFGDDIGKLLAERWQAAGVEVLTGARIREARHDGSGRVTALALEDGTAIACDAILVSIGAVPVTSLVTDQLEIAPDGGIATDASGRTSVPGVFACGDVASWHRRATGGGIRAENWTSAAQQAAVVARAILGECSPATESPLYAWSDQFGLRLQHVGHAEGWAAVRLEGDERSFVARYLDGEGRTLAALAANRQAEVGALRRELAAA
jgi:NADPH-dependent 2,4-dienoyl-CoA reductase/sulfur reductase-like enzyme